MTQGPPSGRYRSGIFLSLIPLLLSAALGWWMSPGQAFSGSELSWLDHLQVLRLRKGQTLPTSRVLLIGVDESTIEWLDKPPMFWLGDFAQLGDALLQAGASGVAYDFIFPSPGEGLGPALSAEFASQRESMLVLLTTGQVALGYLPDSEASPGSHSHVDLERAAETFDALCSLGLVADPDGRVRRIYPVVGQGTSGARPSLAVWALKQSGFPLEWKEPPLRGGSPLAAVPLEPGSEPSLRISYRVPQRNVISAADLWRRLKKGEPIDEVRGKVCIIAPTATSLDDFRPSPLELLASKREQGGTLGIEHHLSALETLENGWFIRPYSPWLGLTLSVALAMILGLIGYHIKGRRSWLVGGLTLVVHASINLAAFVLANVWLPFWAPLGGGLMGFAAGYQWRYSTVERQRRLTVQMFSRMVAPQVVERVLADPSAQVLGGVHRRVTVLYTDINGFTPICERHTPAEVIVLLNHYFEAMVGIVFDHEGMLKQFVGDEIMVIYGAPADQPDHAARAVTTALDMLERLLQMKEEAQGADGFFEVKVGINTGDVVVGHVGSERHMEYAAVGDDVNLGARIMATASKLGVSILVSEVTKREAEPHLPDVEWISHGVQSFKGKTAQLEVFEARRRSREHETD